MRSKKAKNIVWTLILCLGLTLNAVSVMAQKAEDTSTNKININTATVEELQTLPGIGPALAKNIIEHRSKVKKFNKIEEIINVKGMGEKKFLKIKDRLVI